MIPVLILLGVPAGVLTTLAGQGGGLFLLLACSALHGPREALALTAPALLFGNLHRAVLFRRALARDVARRIALGAVPGAIVGGLASAVVPPLVLNLLLVVMTGAALARAAGLVPSLPARALIPAGAVVGALTGTSGGAGVLLSPLLLATGLGGAAFVGTSATVAVLTHAGRLLAYGSLGLLRLELALPVVALTAALFAGNAAGERLRRRLGERTTRALELGVLVVCAALSVAQVR